MSDEQRAPRPGRVTTVIGGILLGISAVITVIAAVYFVTGMISSPEAMSMVFPFLLMFWIFFAAPTWYLGLLLIGIGRSQHRGPVAWAPLAWILACALFPLISLQMILLGAVEPSSALFIVFVVSIPVLIIAGFASAAWLLWGKPRTTPA